MPCTKAPSTTPCAKLASRDPPAKAQFQRYLRVWARARNSKATPRKMRPSSMAVMGAYKAGIAPAYASGKAASSPPPPSTSQVSLPSHTGAIAFVLVARERREQADAEVETVQHHVGEHGEGEQGGPDQRVIEGHGALPP